MPLRDAGLRAAKRRFREIFPGGFADETYLEWERDYKWAAHRAWQATLTDLLLREAEARRYSQRVQRLEEDSRRTKTNLEWLKQTDLDRGPGR